MAVSLISTKPYNVLTDLSEALNGKLPNELIHLVFQYIPSVYSLQKINQGKVHISQDQTSGCFASLTFEGPDKRVYLPSLERSVLFRERHLEEFHYFQVNGSYLCVECTMASRFKIFKMVEGAFETIIDRHHGNFHDAVSSFAIGRKFIYVGFDSGRFLKYDINKNSFIFTDFKSTILAISAQFENRIIVVTKNRIYKMTPNFGTLKEIKSDQTSAYFTKNYLFASYRVSNDIFHLPTLKRVGYLPDGRITAISANQQQLLAVIINYSKLFLYNSLPPWNEHRSFDISTTGDINIEKCALTADQLYLQGFNRGSVFSF